MERKSLVYNNISGNILWSEVWEGTQNAPANILSKFNFSYWELGATSIQNIFFLLHLSLFT